MTALAAELRGVSVFNDLPDDGIDWLASQMETRTFQPGDLIGREGDPVIYMTVLLEGEIRGQHENGHDDGRTYSSHAGQVTGMLPFSRLTNFPVTMRAVTLVRAAMLHKDRFPEMLERLPVLQGRLVSVMADRIREVTAADQQRDKMSALGKLSAGLAHELNNPAAAARRAAATLRQAVADLRDANARLDTLDLTLDQRRSIAKLEREAGSRRESDQHDDPLERSDREDRVTERLTRLGVERPWEIAGCLVEAAADGPVLDEIAAVIPAHAVSAVIARLTAAATVERVAGEIENSTARISELVAAVKEYSYMDQMPEQEVDIHAGIESTLLILKHRLKHGVEVVREFDRTLPKICAKGSDLNQVWTNLIDNAIDALNGQGRIVIRTSREAQNLLVEVTDNGPGIPKEVQPRIFEPFFTTKGVGEGSGLGLDTAYRIVRAHRGDIRVESEPGRTKFQVRLPVKEEKP